ncbi:MAG: arylsulfatase [Verrucomicrobiaceae bacterium]|nr:arylsulfatase [Verrucomicrobiaceae bacterium]
MLRLFCLSFCWLLAVNCTLGASGDRPPNIIFIIADDLGWGDLGCYGQTKIRTPNLDKMASEGVRLTQMHSGNAVCAPSRCVLMTGKHPGHAHIRDNRQWEKAKGLSKIGKPEFEGQEPIPDNEITMAEAFKAAGFTTGGFGKWGLGGPGSTGEPLKQGFDRWYGYNCQGVAHNFYPTYLWDDANPVSLNNHPFQVPDALKSDEDPSNPQVYARFRGNDYAPDLIDEQAIAFATQNKEKPFFIYWPTTVPHVSLQVPEESLLEYTGKWDDPPYPGGKGYLPHHKPKAAYAAMITRMDRDIGQMMATIDKLGLGEHTIFCFTSDNGPLTGTHQGLAGTDCEFFDSNGPFRDGKGTLYEGGFRVPGIVRWKGHIKPAVSDRVCGFEDWMPTLLDLVSASSKAPSGIDGISFAPTLRGETQSERDYLYREFPSYGGQQMIRSGKWKLLKNGLSSKGGKSKRAAKQETALYDLESDPGETKNLASENPAVVSRLESLAASARTPSITFPFPALDK